MQCDYFTLHRIKKEKSTQRTGAKRGRNRSYLNEASTKIDNSTVHISTDKI